jgi:3-deoxy-D-manno-octulosonic-acid transferase
VLARDRESADRLGALGAVDVTVVGDLKHDGLAAAEIAATPDLLVAAEGSLPVLVAASTREGEEELLLSAFEGLRDRARLVVAPRHPERVADLEGLLVRRGLRYKLLGEGDTGGDWEVLVIDTVGKLRGFFTAARAVFVGGSLVDKGGHNLLEPAAYATAVCAGYHLDNVQHQSAALLAGDAIELVADAEALAAVWTGWVDDENKAALAGEAARDVVRSSGGALDTTMAVLEGLL